jgi:hypothetical protein
MDALRRLFRRRRPAEGAWPGSSAAAPAAEARAAPAEAPPAASPPPAPPPPPPRPARPSRAERATADRVHTIGALLDALRRLEADRAYSAAAAGRPAPAARGGSLAVFAAIALQELDAVMDELSYEDLLRLFGDDSRRRPTLEHAALARLPARAPTAAEAAQACAICLQPLGACAGGGARKATRVRELPCGHVLHGPGCLDTWLSDFNASCPVCRCRVGARDKAAAAASLAAAPISPRR